MRVLIFLAGGPLMNAMVTLFIVMPAFALVRGDERWWRFVELATLPYAALFFIVIAIIPAFASLTADRWLATSALWRRVTACAVAGFSGGLLFPAALAWPGIQDRSTLMFAVLGAMMGAACCRWASRYERQMGR
jgi:hypothetical protein